MRSTTILLLLLINVVFIENSIAESPNVPTSNTAVSEQKMLVEYLIERRKGIYCQCIDIACSFNEDASVVALGNNLDRILILDLNKGEKICEVRNGYNSFICSHFRLSPDATMLVTCGADSAPLPEKIRKILSESVLSQHRNYSDPSTGFLVFNAQTGDYIKRVGVVPIPYTSTSRLISRSDIPDFEKLLAQSGAYVKVKDGVYAALADKVVIKDRAYASFRFIDDSGSIICGVTATPFRGFTKGVLAESIDILTGELKKIYIYECHEGDPDYNLHIPEFGPIKAIEKSGDGNRIVLMGGSFHDIVLFDTQTGRVISAARREEKGPTDVRLQRALNFAGCLCMNHDGTLLARQGTSSSSQRVRDILEKREGDRFNKMCNFPKGCSVAIQDTMTAKVVYMLETPDPLIITDMSFSKDGKYLAAGTIWGHVFIWDMKTGKMVKHFCAPNGSTIATMVAFSQDKIVAIATESFGEKGSIFKWNFSDGKLLEQMDYEMMPYSTTKIKKRR